MKFEKKTNFDKLKEMTAEKAAAVLADNDGCPPPMKNEPCRGRACEQCWLDWLNKEVEK